MYFVDKNFDLVTEMMYAIPCYTRPYYNGTRLYIASGMSQLWQTMGNIWKGNEVIASGSSVDKGNH